MKRMLTIATAILFSAGAAHAQAKKDQDALQGTWNVVSAMDGGRAKDKKAGVKMIFNGNVISLVTPKRKEPDVKFTLDPSKNPKWIDINVKEGRVLKGIYEIKGDKLRICFNEKSEGERSTRFESLRDSPNDVLLVMERTKKE